jgi:hypothetical protein
LCIILCFVVVQNHLSGRGGGLSSFFFAPAETSYLCTLIWKKTVLLGRRDSTPTI